MQIMSNACVRMPLRNLEVLNKSMLVFLPMVTRLTFEIMCSNVYNETKQN